MRASKHFVKYYRRRFVKYFTVLRQHPDPHSCDTHVGFSPPAPLYSIWTLAACTLQQGGVEAADLHVVVGEDVESRRQGDEDSDMLRVAADVDDFLDLLAS